MASTNQHSLLTNQHFYISSERNRTQRRTKARKPKMHILKLVIEMESLRLMQC